MASLPRLQTITTKYSIGCSREARGLLRATTIYPSAINLLSSRRKLHSHIMTPDPNQRKIDSRFLKSSKLASHSGHNACSDLFVWEHVFSFPLNWDNVDDPNARKIEVFVREIGSRQSYATGKTKVLLYLQGGPGFPSPRPSTPISGWMKVALDKGYRVALLDQRGTGLSTAMTVQRLMHLETEGGIQLQAQYLGNMRADAIAEDVEAIRNAFGCGKITLLGQSFGGFCILTYLSRYSANVDTGIFTCGLAPVLQNVHEVYSATYRRMLVRNRRFYRAHPEDVEKVKRIVAHLHSKTLSSRAVVLPGGGSLTVRRFLQLGHMLGSGSGIDRLHNLLENAWFEYNGPEDSILNESFLHDIEVEQSSFESSPIYWLMHESIYMNGGSDASKWAAETVMESAEFKDSFDYLKTLNDDTSHINFTGEMVYSWMGEDYARLRPLQAVAKQLAEKVWDKPLYDLNELKGVAKKVPCSALVSYDDVYVERTFSLETAELLGGEDYCKMWITNEFQHSGLHDNPTKVLGTLLGMVTGGMSIPS